MSRESTANSEVAPVLHALRPESIHHSRPVAPMLPKRRPKPPPTGITAEVPEDVKSWFTSIGLPDLAESFIAEGYDDIRFLELSAEDLDVVGVTNPEVR